MKYLVSSLLYSKKFTVKIGTDSMRLFKISIPLLWILSFILTGCEKDKFVIHELPKIYDETADARLDIQMAIEKARIDEKRVLLMFGGNWCPWCHRLHHLFMVDSRIKKALKNNYILVMINVGDDKDRLDSELNELYGDPFQYGFPVLVVLDRDGNRLTTQETGSLEKTEAEGQKKGHNPDKVLSFLDKWK